MGGEERRGEGTRTGGEGAWAGEVRAHGQERARGWERRGHTGGGGEGKRVGE